jgi:uncharacterized protein
MQETNQFEGNLWFSAYQLDLPDNRFVKIKETTYVQPLAISTKGEVLLLPAEISETNLASLPQDYLNPIMPTDLSCIILGTTQMRWIHEWTSCPALIQIMKTCKTPVGIEVMSPSAACRTYNLLASESRPTMALIIF